MAATNAKPESNPSDDPIVAGSAGPVAAIPADIGHEVYRNIAELAQPTWQDNAPDADPDWAIIRLSFWWVRPQSIDRLFLELSPAQLDRVASALAHSMKKWARRWDLQPEAADLPPPLRLSDLQLGRYRAWKLQRIREVRP